MTGVRRLHILLLLLFASPEVAAAQMFNPNLIGGVMGPVVMNPCISSPACDARGSTRHAQPTRPSHSPIDTRYRADPAVSARVRRRFMDFVARTSGAAGAQGLAAAFAKTDPMAAWAREAAPDGMRPGDVVDAMAEYWVQNWLMANRQTGDASHNRVRDVRDQLKRGLASNPAFARLDNAQRQEMAEVCILNTILQGSVYQNALHAHDAALIQRVSDAAEIRLRNEAHVDLRGVVLTPAGFAPRA